MADKRDENGQLDGSEVTVVGVGYGYGCARQSVGKPSRRMGKETVYWAQGTVENVRTSEHVWCDDTSRSLINIWCKVGC